MKDADGSKCAFILFGIFMLAPYSVFAATPEEIFAKDSLSVVVVDVFGAQGKSIGLGSGVVIDVGQVITNCHVVQKGSSLQVRQSGKTFKATLKYADPDRDLCQLSVPALLAPAVSISTAKKLRVGQRVYAIGAPKGLELTLSEGLVSSLRQLEGSQYIQTSAAISPGSSGGGLFDDHGRLIGITTFQLAEGQNLNFALPADWIEQLPRRAQSALTSIKGELDWVNRAAALAQKKDWARLLELSRKWVEKAPDSVIAWDSMGHAKINLQQYGDAIIACQNALKIQSENSFAWNNIGLAYHGLSQIDNAIKAYKEALRIQPEEAEVWYNLGTAYFYLRQYEKAIQATKEALRIQPEFAKAWGNLGSAYRQLKQYEQAIQHHREAIRIDPEYFIAWSNLGVAYADLKQYDQAIQSYRAALRIQPKFAEAWHSMGTAYAGLAQYDQAILAFREAIRIQPKHAIAWINLGVVYYDTQQYDQSIHSVLEALRITPENTVALGNLGRAYYAQGRLDKAREVYKKLRALDPAEAESFISALNLY